MVKEYVGGTGAFTYASDLSHAMTVHKTQGSKFSIVLLILPEVPHSLLSRDLLYTGITQAKNTVVVYGVEDAVRVGCETGRVRASRLLGGALTERCWPIATISFQS